MATLRAVILWNTCGTVKRRQENRPAESSAVTRGMVLKGAIVRSRLVGRRPLALAESLAELAPIGLPFFRRHILPLLTHRLPLFLRQGAEPLSGIANRLPLFRRQFPKTLESLAQPLLIVRRHLPPLLEPLMGFSPLLGIHVRPLPRAIPQALLTIRGKLIPVLIEFLQDLLFRLAQLVPRHTWRVGLSPGRQAPSAEHDDSEHQSHHGVISR